MNAHVRHVTGAQAVTVQSVARRMFDESNGDMNSATDKLVNYVNNFPRLAEEILRIGARKLINEIPQVERRAIERIDAAGAPFASAPHRMNDGARRAQERILKRAGVIKDMLMNAPYTIGNQCKALREWLGEEILSHGETQLVSGATQVRNARYLIAIGQAAGAKKVGEALQEKDLERLRDEAMSSAV